MRYYPERKDPDFENKMQEVILVYKQVKMQFDDSAHTSKETKWYLATLPEGRFIFVFTPTHTSWLNMIESFFSKMTKQMLKGIRIASKEELSVRIYQYFDEINAEPVVYQWTYKIDEIEPDEIQNCKQSTM